jgi:hypothetical protein
MLEDNEVGKESEARDKNTDEAETLEANKEEELVNAYSAAIEVETDDQDIGMTEDKHGEEIADGDGKVEEENSGDSGDEAITENPLGSDMNADDPFAPLSKRQKKLKEKKIITNTPEYFQVDAFIWFILINF